MRPVAKLPAHKAGKAGKPSGTLSHGRGRLSSAPAGTPARRHGGGTASSRPQSSGKPARKPWQKREGKGSNKRKDEEDELSEVEEVPLEESAASDDDDVSRANGRREEGGQHHGMEEEDEEEPSSDEEGDDGAEEEDREIRRQQKAANRKGKKSGGFQSMGLSSAIFKAIEHKGYKIPTPIQRKAIPIIMDKRDIVAMARTGSGKTAAFLIPLLERLKAHSAKTGARALILSPSRELAFQTLKFCKEFGKYTDLRSCMLVGGDRMEEQFSLMTTNPDIIIATPGRLMHLIIEMSLDLSMVEYVVFDEADRLFELGFAEHLREILFKLPEARQTLLFSATLPRLLVDFARAGLTDPVLVRLDVDIKISKDLQSYFFALKADEKEGALIQLLTTQIPRDELTIIFASTKHHVEYLHELLLACGFDNTYIYGSLDQSARKYNLAQFRAGKTKIFIVTDVASRGIDIPLLDNVVNYNFPGSSKVFIHRVGRAARAGRSGRAWSLLATDEIPFMLDLQLFTGKSLVFASAFEGVAGQGKTPDYLSDFILGQFPASSLSLEVENVLSLHKGNAVLEHLKEAAVNAYRLYLKSRPTASSESHKRAKEMADAYLGIHPTFAEAEDEAEKARAAMLSSLAHFRPGETVFEVGKKGNKTPEAQLMLARRSKLTTTITAARGQKRERDAERMSSMAKVLAQTAGGQHADQMEGVGEEELAAAFPSSTSSPKSAKGGSTTTTGTKQKRKREPAGSFKDGEFYMNYQPEDAATEKGYAMRGEGSGVSFLEKAQAATIDLTADDVEGLRKKPALTWDSTKHRFQRNVIGSDNKKKIRSESGVLVDASYKTDRFRDWQRKAKIVLPRAGERELPLSQQPLHGAGGRGVQPGGRTYRHNSITAPTPNSKSSIRKAMRREREGREKQQPQPEGAKDGRAGATSLPAAHTGAKGARNELKSVSQIAKAREEKERRRQKTGRHQPGGKVGRPTKGGASKKRPVPKSKFKPLRKGGRK